VRDPETAVVGVSRFASCSWNKKGKGTPTTKSLVFPDIFSLFRILNHT